MIETKAFEWASEMNKTQPIADKRKITNEVAWKIAQSQFTKKASSTRDNKTLSASHCYSVNSNNK